MLVNVISLQSFHQSTLNLIYDVIPPKLTSNLIYGVIPTKGQTLLILGHMLKSTWPPSNFYVYVYVLFKVIYACECNIFKIIPPIDLKLENLFISSRGRTLLILGHLL